MDISCMAKMANSLVIVQRRLSNVNEDMNKDHSWGKSLNHICMQKKHYTENPGIDMLHCFRKFVVLMSTLFSEKL